jgi:hypothetical protein
MSWKKLFGLCDHDWRVVEKPQVIRDIPERYIFDFSVVFTCSRCSKRMEKINPNMVDYFNRTIK